MGVSSKKLTIQIVGWNSVEDLPVGISALARIPVEAIALLYIDNASTDGSVELVRKVLPHAEILVLPTNTGFAHAHNIGFARCQTPFVMLHNPDLVIDWPGVQQLLGQFADPTVGAVQGKLLQPDRQHLDSTGIVLTRTLNGKDRGSGEVDRGQYDTRKTVLAVTGACAIYRLSALKAVAHTNNEFFDEDFFAYKEDVDLGWRLSRAGWHVLYQPIIVGTHTRAVRKEGLGNWGLNPYRIYQRLRSPRTRYSLRNWVWMVSKNATLSQLLRHELFIDLRVGLFFLLTVAYPPLFSVWREIFQKMPQILHKREQVQALAEKTPPHHIHEQI